jgi:ABC-type sugar transport system permease subunit
MLKNNTKSTRFEPYLLVLPFIVHFFVFSLFPILFTLFLSFQKWNGLGKMEFVGLNNYAFLLTEDMYFPRSVMVTVILLIFGSLTQHLFAIPLAVAINSKLIRGKSLFKTAFFLPYMTNAISIALIFSYLFSLRSGVVNYALNLLGIGSIDWFLTTDQTQMVIATVVNWRYIGWNILLYLAGLQTIPESVYEAADMDGASTATKHLQITLPLLVPVIVFTVSLSLLQGVQLFEEPLMLTGGTIDTNGGVNNGGLTLAFYIIYLLRRTAMLGRGSAVAWILFVVMAVVMVLNRKVFIKTK